MSHEKNMANNLKKSENCTIIDRKPLKMLDY